MIKIKNLSKRFEDVQAISHLNLEIEHGIVGLVGHNGAGKSTLLRLIADILYPDEGKIEIDGLINSTRDAKEKVFFLPDDPYVPSFARLKDLYELYASFYPLDYQKFMNLVHEFSLPLDQRINNFSKGMKRQLFLALTFSIDAKYYLLDEAFDGIDPLALEKIKEIILQLNNDGKIIIISSHNIATLQRLVERFIILSGGEISRDGNNEMLGVDFLKYQMITPRIVTKEVLSALNLKPLNFKKVGSIYHLVFFGKKEEEISKILTEEFSPTLLEQIPIDTEEIITLEMILAREEQKHENKTLY